jgi:hypothetical protein
MLQGQHAVAAGGFGDVWQGEYQGQKIAVKKIRIYQNSDLNKLQQVSLCRAFVL